MIGAWSRRSLLKFASVFVPMNALALRRQPPDPALDGDGNISAMPIADTFPSQPHELVREMVTVSHFDLNRVKELVEGRPSLARAAWHWGCGDWEAALEAASHTAYHGI